jgi:hypothetical protein
MTEQKRPDYVDGSWHQIVFHSDLPDIEITRFATTIRGTFEAENMPEGCEARIHEADSGVQTVFLSPNASRLAAKHSTYAPLLESCYSPDNFAERRRMRIFD